MKMHSVFALALGLVALPAAAQTAASEATTAVVPPAALTAAEIKLGANVFSAEGRKIGKVDRVRGDSVAVIRDMKMIYIPIASLTASERGLVSTLSNRDINRL